MSRHVISCHVIEKRYTLSSAKRMSLSPLYREGRDTLSSADRREYVVSCHVRACHAMSSRRETLSPLQREGACRVMSGHVMSCPVIEKRDTLSSAKRMTLSPLYILYRKSLSILFI
jgi:hypothetical protein